MTTSGSELRNCQAGRHRCEKTVASRIAFSSRPESKQQREPVERSHITVATEVKLKARLPLFLEPAPS